MGAAFRKNIKLLWISRRPVSRGFRVARHAHPWWQYLLVEDGHVLTMIDDDYSLLSKEQVAIMPGNTTHSFYATTNAQIIEIKFHVTDSWLNNTFKSADIKSGPVNREITSAVNFIVKEGANKNLYYDEIVTLSVYQLLLLHLRHESASSGEEPTGENKTLSKSTVKKKALRIIDESDELRAGKLSVAGIIQYMDDHIQDHISLEILAGKFNYTKSYLCQIFSSTIGVPPMRYLTLLRLDRAKELLTNGTASVQRIRGETGFSSVHQMWRVFRAETGHSPTEYRRLYAHSKTAVIDFTGLNESKWTQLLSL